MLETILHNLTNIGWAMLIFLCAYLSNVSFSLYYNIKVLLEPFSKEKLINSGLKITARVASAASQRGTCHPLKCTPARRLTNGRPMTASTAETRM